MNVWDLFIVLLLFANCIFMPYMIAFENTDMTWQLFSLFIDILFFCDIIVIFCSAYYDEEHQIIEDRWLIALNYTRSGWLFIDILAIFPFDVIEGESYFFNS